VALFTPPFALNAFVDKGFKSTTFSSFSFSTSNTTFSSSYNLNLTSVETRSGFLIKTSKGIKLIPFGLTLIPFGVKSIPFGIKLIPFGQKLIPFGITSIPFGVRLTPGGLTLAPFGVALTPYGQVRFRSQNRAEASYKCSINN
jgi:hypothetical protein